MTTQQEIKQKLNELRVILKAKGLVTDNRSDKELLLDLICIEIKRLTK
jgi:hypothetical protein